MTMPRFLLWLLLGLTVAVVGGTMLMVARIIGHIVRALTIA